MENILIIKAKIDSKYKKFYCEKRKFFKTVNYFEE